MADEPSELHQLRALMAGLRARQRERARLLTQLRLVVEQAGAVDINAVAAIPPLPDSEAETSSAPRWRWTGWRRR
jgi:hypothetical protein